jgi:hypothetical protein
LFHFQVHNLRLDIFCCHPVETCLPVDNAYKPISVNPNPADGNLLGLHHREMGLGSEFAGSQCVSVGFMQSVLEVLAMPIDIVLDWAGWGRFNFLGRGICATGLLLELRIEQSLPTLQRGP